MFSFQAIYDAYIACRKHKRNTLNQLQFEVNLLDNLWNLQSELSTQTYKIGSSLCFLTSSPKLREVFAADFRDRVVHHVLIRAIEPFYEKKFIHDVYNNRKNRGTHSAIKQAQRYMHRNTQGYYLQLDIKGFFYNLDKNILFKQLFNDISNSTLKNKKEILWLSNKIIYHNPTRNYIFKGDKSKLELLPEHKTLFKLPSHLGLPIGNLTSQFFANVYMNGFDNYVKRVLKVKSYIRYVDDSVIFDISKERLERLHVKIALYLKDNLGLLLREDTKLKKHSSGLDFLGYIIRENYILTRKRIVNNYKFKKANYLQNYENQRGKMSLEEIKKFLSVQASFVGHIKHSNSYNLLKKVGTINETDPFSFNHKR
ncbi:MAG: reverse transcriptase/maturase family protein [Campylobacterota bacterium]|nr:reverse transcriptase/maturase family protein [Campylobacterota bacterium]